MSRGRIGVCPIADIRDIRAAKLVVKEKIMRDVFDRLQAIFWLTEDEVTVALKNYPAFHSAHEGFAVLKEEVDELWDEVKKKPDARSKAKMKAECIQIAAMAIRFSLELCDKDE